MRASDAASAPGSWLSAAIRAFFASELTRPAALSLQLEMDTRAAITPAGVAVDPPDVVDEVTIGSRSSALSARAPGIIAGRRDAKHVTQERHRIIGAAIFDEADSHVRVPAKIAIDFLRNSRIGGAWNGL
ncbi:hypothetical protein XH93_10100 [Bradyrhizobium sp. CCBAU 51753]|nr:hypothetical protein XH93_10100 [Bradyrhizobium sp. CCBAU 51753]